MVSRRKILSRSRDDLNLDQTFSPQEEEEDVWYQKDKLYKEHIQEVLDKWTQIDDEIWAKVIVFERNRRVAKAYARAPVLTINGSDDGFDGMRIGLCGFDNPMRDQKTEEFKKHIGQGVKIKMDDAGNILVRRYAKSNVYIKSTANTQNEETSIGADIMKLPNQALESEKIVKLFDMKKFQSNVNRELRRAYPDRRRLETQCLSAVAFVKSESDILECPIWVLIVNVVAMDMLKSKLPPVQRPLVDIKNRPRIPIPDEDPYSVAGNGSGGSSGSSGFGASAMGSMMSGHNVQLQLQHQQQQLQQQQQSQSMTNGSNGGGGGGNANLLLNNASVMGAGINGHVAATREQLILQTQQLALKRSEKPPKLPPRDNIYGTHEIPKPDYDDIEVDTRIKLSRGKSDKGKDNKKYDDPYYCGLRARVPNFVKSSSKSAKEHHAALTNGVAAQNAMNTLTNQKKTSIMMPMHPAMHAPAPPHMHPHHIQQQQMMAVAAAHAVAQQQQQQQQQHQHPIHHHAHAHAQQMWQTRSFESGIGIYNHNTSATTTTTTPAALTATATTFISSTETQQPLVALPLPLALPLQPTLQPQQTNKQPHERTNGNSTKTTATTTATAGMYYPSGATATTSTLYNYLAPYSNEHHLQAMPIMPPMPMSMPITATSAGTTASPSSSSTNSPPSASMPNANGNLLHPQQQSPQSLSLGLSTNMTNMNYSTGPPPSTTHPFQTDLNENIYGQTRNVNFTQVHPHQQQQQQHQHHNNSGNGNDFGSGNYHHNHHQHHHRSYPQHTPHHPSHHHRRPHGSQHMCLRHPHAPSQATPGEFYYKTHDLYYNRDDLDVERHRRHQGRPSRRSASSSAQIGKNCNCVSCYALAPLFGAPTPKRPSRSLSQQQLRQHHLLSGAAAKERPSHMAQPRSVVKWCSDSDVSLLGREDLSQSEETDEYRSYKTARTNNDYSSAFDLNNDFDMDDLNLSQMDYKRQLEKPRKSQKFNGYAARHKYRQHSPHKEHHHPPSDGYVDKARLRQMRSPTLQRKTSIKINDVPAKSPTNLMQMRSKSQSTESFFEEPNEEGTLYLYGGRKRIVKAPSTTNIYDRVKTSEAQRQSLKNAKKYNSQLNLSSAERKADKDTMKDDNAESDTIQPLVPPPLWRGAKRMNLKSLISPKANSGTKNIDINNNLVTKTETILNNFLNKNDLATGQQTSPAKDHQQQEPVPQNPGDNNNQHQQVPPPPPQSGRASRSSSRVDISDMESIYGYLKPRKPRSLSLKKIQILDY